jgi:hypothetical protein
MQSIEGIDTSFQRAYEAIIDNGGYVDADVVDAEEAIRNSLMGVSVEADNYGSCAMLTFRRFVEPTKTDNYAGVFARVVAVDGHVVAEKSQVSSSYAMKDGGYEYRPLSDAPEYTMSLIESALGQMSLLATEPAE